MRPIELSLVLDNASATGIASASSSASTSVTLNGSLVSGGTYTSVDGLGHIIVITDESADTQTDVTFTITGTDPNGDAITNTITGPGSGLTVVSSKYFKTVSAVSVSSAQGGSETVNIGTRGTTLSAASQAIPLDWRSPVAAAVDVTVSGTINFTVQETFSNLLTSTNASGNINWHDVSALASKSANTTAQLSVGARGVRVLINTFSSGASLKVVIDQPGMYD